MSEGKLNEEKIVGTGHALCRAQVGLEVSLLAVRLVKV
jgi:hypothetical protein